MTGFTDAAERAMRVVARADPPASPAGRQGKHAPIEARADVAAESGSNRAIGDAGHPSPNPYAPGDAVRFKSVPGSGHGRPGRVYEVRAVDGDMVWMCPPGQHGGHVTARWGWLDRAQGEAT